MKKTYLATLAALTGYGIFGFSFLFSKLALDITSESILLAFRFLVAFLVLNIILIIKRKKISFTGKPVFRLLIMGLFQPIVYFICEARGIALTTSSFSGVMIGLAPVAGVIIGALFFSERASVLQIICAILSVIGVAMTAVGDMGKFSLPGFLFLLGAVISAAAFTALSRSISDKFSPFERTYLMFAMGSVVFTIMALVQNKPSDFIAPLTSLPFWISVLYLAVLSSVCAFLFINFALGHISTGHTLILSNFTTVVSVLAGMFILGDNFEPIQKIGVAVIIISVFGVSIKKDLNGRLR